MRADIFGNRFAGSHLTRNISQKNEAMDCNYKFTVHCVQYPLGKVTVILFYTVNEVNLVTE